MEQVPWATRSQGKVKEEEAESAGIQGEKHGARQAQHNNWLMSR